MLPEVLTALNGVKTAVDIVKTMSDLKTASEVASVKIELQGILIDVQSKILELQQSYQELLSDNASINQKIMDSSKWEEDASQYEFFRTGSGNIVFAAKPNTELAKQYHWLCPTCFHNKQKTPLQPKLKGLMAMVCPICDKIEISISDSERDLLGVPQSQAAKAYASMFGNG